LAKSVDDPPEKEIMHKSKILIIDDDADLRHALNLRFRANHYDTTYAVDGLSAIAIAQKEKPDVIILDVGLPAGDGFVVLDRLQQNAALANIPVIVLTARDPHSSRQRLINAGATAFFQKPADNVQLLNAVRAVLSPSWAGTEIASF
jgi:DNA-binding response OmpR family regulator